MKHLSLIISTIALAGVVILFLRTDPVKTDRNDHGHGSHSAHEGEEHDEIEIAIIMGRIQRFHQKYWLALRSSNAELAQFYLHEMEEAMEEIAEANVVDEGIDISANMRTYGLKVNEHLQKILKEEGVSRSMQESELLVQSCNTCHERSGYGLIEIKVPDEFSVPDQVMISSKSNQNQN